ncbi:MAG: Flp family type IVb pilin [Terriglobales bacterium]
MKHKIARFWSDNSGEDLAEYAIALGVVAAIALAAFTTLGTDISTVVQNIAGKISPPGN